MVLGVTGTHCGTNTIFRFVRAGSIFLSSLIGVQTEAEMQCSASHGFHASQGPLFRRSYSSP